MPPAFAKLAESIPWLNRLFMRKPDEPLAEVFDVPFGRESKIEMPSDEPPEETGPAVIPRGW